MSTPEQGGTVVVEQKSSIKITRNAKGENQYEVKVVAGESDDTLTTMRTQAVAHYQAVGRELGAQA